jgi:hypothetical protein
VPFLLYLLVPYLLITKDIRLKTSVSSTSNAAKPGFMPAKKTKKNERSGRTFLIILLALAILFGYIPLVKKKRKLI